MILLNTKQVYTLAGKSRQWVGTVVLNPRRKTPHPLAAAKVGRGAWDEAKVKAWIEQQKPK